MCISRVFTWNIEICVYVERIFVSVSVHAAPRRASYERVYSRVICFWVCVLVFRVCVPRELSRTGRVLSRQKRKSRTSFALVPHTVKLCRETVDHRRFYIYNRVGERVNSSSSYFYLARSPIPRFSRPWEIFTWNRQPAFFHFINTSSVNSKSRRAMRDTDVSPTVFSLLSTSAILFNWSFLPKSWRLLINQALDVILCLHSTIESVETTKCGERDEFC